MNLRDPEVALRAWHAAADRISDPIGHLRHGKASVEAEAVTTQVAPGVLVEIKGVEGAAQAGLEIAEQGVDPTELGQIVGMLPAGDDRLVVAARRGHGTETGQAIGEHLTTGSQMLYGPVLDRLTAEAQDRRDLGVDGMTRLVQRDRSHDRNLVLRSPSCLAARSFSAEIGIIELDLSPQNAGLFPFAHGPEDLVVQQPGGVVVDAQMAAELERGNPRFGLTDQVKRQKPSRQRQFRRLHDRAGDDCGLMSAGAALKTLEPPSVDQAMLLAIAAGTAEAIGPAGLLQSRLTLLLSAVEPLELRQRETLLELDAVARHDSTSTCVPV